MIIIETEGEDCIVTINSETRRVNNCNAVKLANTLWDKDGEKYSDDEMSDFGFEKRTALHEV